MKNGWQTKTLGEVLQKTETVNPLQSPETEFDYIDVSSVSNATFQIEATQRLKGKNAPSRARKLVRENDVLFATVRPTLQRIAVVPEHLDKQVCSTGYFVLRAKHGIDHRFVFYSLFTEDFIAQMESLQKGASYPAVTDGDVKAQVIPVPPLPEQKRIVGILDEAFEGIATAKANAEKNLQNARALFESLLNAAIQGELIPQDSRDDSAAELIVQIEKARKVAIAQGRAKAEKSEPLERKMDGVIKLPRTWKWAQLESLTVGISDGVHKKPHYVSTGVPFITVKNLTAGPSISFDELNYVTRKDHEEFIKRTHPEKGDILITKDGTIGVVRLIDTDVEFSIFVSVALIKPVMRELAPYLVYALRASCVQSQIVPQGAALKHLYLVDLRRLAIPIPPLKEQKRIVAALDALDAETQRLARLYQQKLDALEALKRSLLHQAFTGQLTMDNG